MTHPFPTRRTSDLRFEADILGVRDDADRDDRVAEFGAFGLAVLGLDLRGDAGRGRLQFLDRSDEHTSELQSLMRTSYADFCLTKKPPPTSTSTTHATCTSSIHHHTHFILCP